MRSVRCAGRRGLVQAGFTMIEILVVLAIVAVILALLSPTLFSLAGRGDVTETQALIVNVATSLKTYATNPRYGALPSTEINESFLDLPDGARFKPNDTNLGIESLVFHLTHEDYDGESPFTDDDRFINSDSDEASLQLTWTGKDLFEYADSWGNPLVYFNLEDLEAAQKPRFRVTLASGEDITVEPVKSRKFKGMYAGRSDGFQIISLGPDGEFGTGDDILSWAVSGSADEGEEEES